MSISKQFQRYHQDDVGRKIEELIDFANKSTAIELGNVMATDLLSSKITAGKSGIYGYYDTSSSLRAFTLVNFSSDGTQIGGFTVKGANLYYCPASTVFVSATYASLCAKYVYETPIYFLSVTSINSNLGGTPTYRAENSTLHIRGTFTPTATIAAGTKLFATGQALDNKMTHGSAINTGATGSETFVGISIQTNGDVYCLGALTAGVTYSIAVTATL